MIKTLLFCAGIATIVLVNANAQVRNFQDCVDAYLGQRPDAPRICNVFVEAGNPEAQKMRGDMHYWGWGDAVEQDFHDAVLWYKRAGSKGNAEAKYNLGVMYENGQGLDRDYRRAYQWYRSAAEDGHAGAQYNLGNMYSVGSGIKQSQSEAVKWYKRAAEQGVVEAQYNLANRYATNNGVSIDAIEAYKWYTIAAEQGFEPALENKSRVLEELNSAQMSEALKRARAWRPKKEEKKEE